MKKSIKSLVAMGMSLMTAMSFAGCGSKTSNSGTSGESIENKDVKKPDSIKWYINVGLTLDDGAEKWKEEYTKKTGISLDFTPQSNNEYYQNLDLAFASKSAPDVFNLAGQDKLPIYAKQGALADITDLVKSSKLYDEIDQKVWDSVTVDGKIYGVPFEVGTGTVTYIRKDWLDRVGLKEPTTYDEFINMLKAFKEQIPECTIPYTAPGLYENGACNYLREFYQNANPDFVKVDDKWVDGMAEDNMKDALKRMQEAYKDGLIDLEVVTNTTSACRDKWYSGNVGVFNYWAGQWAVSIADRVKVNDSNAVVEPIDAIKETSYNICVPAVTCISSSCKNKEGAYKYFVEYMHDGGEGQVLFDNGVEDLHWKQDGDKLVKLPKLSNENELNEKAFIAPDLAPTKLQLTDKKIDTDERLTNSLKLLNKDGKQQITQPSSKKLTKISSDLTALKSQIISKVVMGDMTVDEGIDKYKNEAKNLGVDEVLKEMNE